MYLLRKRIVNLHLPVDCQLKHLDLTNEPILLYGSELCGFENHLDIFRKKVLKTKKSTLHVMVYGESGKYPLQIAVNIRLIKFWSKLLTEKNNKSVTMS